MDTTQDEASDRIYVSRWTAGALSVAMGAADARYPDVTVLGAQGEIDLETTPMLREILVPVLERSSGPVVVDLCEVTFMDSTGVHLLVDTLRRLESENRSLAIACREGGQVHRIFAVVGLLGAVTVHRSVESAVSGGDDLIHPEPDRDVGRSYARALNHTLPPAGQTTES
jgi:anti-sigma B factor antagonist